MHEPPDAVPPVPPLPPADGRPPLPADETPADPSPESRFSPATFRAPATFQAAPDLTPRPFRFTGSGGEYFRIWIVNLLLSVVTLGIYSAWAKVRRLRYFYGHTSIDGQAFGYHATPIAILKGRLIAYAVVILLAALSQFAPLLASVVYFPLVMITPIILVRAFRFRAANSSLRGIRFAFDGLESEAYRVFLLLPLLVPFTLGVLYPVVMKRQREFYVGESRYGRAQFGLEMPTGAVYRIYLLAFVGFLVLAAVAASVMFGSMTAAGAAPGAEAPPGPGVIVGFLLLYVGFGAIVVSVRTAFENLVWNHTRLDVHHFESRLRGRTMLWLYATNVLLVAGTLGLGVPWARVRMARYRADSLTLIPGGPLATEAMRGSESDVATGAELSDAMDLDFGL
jgi:uncharacterized membrane protein YjgN (DUF898 family)